MSDPLIESYRAAHAALVAERAAILARMAAIDDALASVPGPVPRRPGRPRRIPSDAPAPVPVAPPSADPAVRPVRPVAAASAPVMRVVDPGTVNLREAILLALSHGPANRADLLRRIHQMGYRFNKSNPVESLDVLLGDPRTGVLQRGRRFALA